ncbi:hypothetical protein MMC19_001133 [Ptychographa xylographoides]|nr:hypothetical protein [Ptychographa xylographoides]
MRGSISPRCFLYISSLSTLFRKVLCLGSGPDLGTFLFPQENTKPTFNYLDSINVTWSTFDPNITSPFLQLWLGTSSAPLNITLVYNASVAANSSILMPLNYGQPFNGSVFCITQTTINVSYNSTAFNIQKNEKVLPVTWNLYATAASAPTPTTSSTTRPTMIPTEVPAPASATAESAVSSPTLSESSIIAVAVCASLTLVAITALVCILLRHLRRSPRRPGKAKVVELAGDVCAVELEAGNSKSRNMEAGNLKAFECKVEKCESEFCERLDDKPLPPNPIGKGVGEM